MIIKKWKWTGACVQQWHNDHPKGNILEPGKKKAENRQMKQNHGSSSSTKCMQTIRQHQGDIRDVVEKERVRETNRES